MLFASVNPTIGAFRIKTHHSEHLFIKSNQLKMVDTKFIADHVKDRIISQPGISYKQLAKLCKEQLKVFL